MERAAAKNPMPSREEILEDLQEEFSLIISRWREDFLRRAEIEKQEEAETQKEPTKRVEELSGEYVCKRVLRFP
jgi:hypothetical protein